MRPRSRSTGHAALGLAALALPWVVACGGDEAAPPSRASGGPSEAGGHYHYGGGPREGGGGAVGGWGGLPGGGGGGRRGGGGGGGGGGVTTGGEIGERMRRRNAERERWLRDELASMGPRRLTDEYHDENPEFAVIEPMIRAAGDAAARDTTSDECEREWTFQETLAEESGARRSRADRDAYLRDCRATPAAVRRCANPDYRTLHAEECDRETGAIERRGRGMTGAARRGDGDAMTDALRGALPDARRRAVGAGVGAGLDRLLGESDEPEEPATGSSGSLGEDAELAPGSVAPDGEASDEPLEADITPP